MTTQNLLVELFVEELPPKALRKLGEAFAGRLFDELVSSRFVEPEQESRMQWFASPRRLAALIPDVNGSTPETLEVRKLMPKKVAYGPDGQPTKALSRKLERLGYPAGVVPTDDLSVQTEGDAEYLFLRQVIAGRQLAPALQSALDSAIKALPIPKLMTYQLPDGWTDVKFVRPAHSLIALHGSDVVPVQALGLKSGNTTKGHRFEAALPTVTLRNADSYAETMEQDGAVIASFDRRKQEIHDQVVARAPEGCFPLIDPDGSIDDALMEEVTALVERPNVLVCQFDSEFLEVPQECLILTMKANQKYFPLLDAQGRLTNRFLVVSNIRPDDASAVIQGNERVVRPRLADAKFFFDQDRKKTLESRVAGLANVVYHNKLGTQGARTERVVQLVARIVQLLGKNNVDPGFLSDAIWAARLAKADLVTDMVGEFPELQGTMGRYYALNDRLPQDVADAIEDHYRPRFAGDELPRSQTGLVVALADKLETLAGLFSIGQLPTGDKDPFALRRHALGVVRMLMERDLPLDVGPLLASANSVFRELSETWSDDDQVSAAFNSGELSKFIYDRLSGLLRDQGYIAQEVDAVLALGPQRLGDIPKRLAAVRAFAALREAPALAAANKRISNILKKAEKADAHVSEALLKEPAEQALHAAMKDIAPRAGAQFDAGDYAASLQTLAALRGPVDAFFDGVMVNAQEADLRLNRLGLLATLHQAMNRVADLSRLAS